MTASVRRALFFSIMEKYSTIALFLASNLIVARFLTPSEIGLFAVAASIIGIAQAIRDFGVGNYLIQEKDLTESKVRTAFGLSLLLGALFFLVFVASATWIAGFYGERRLSFLVQLIACNFLILPFCSISLALLRRDMHFKVVMYANILGTIASFVTTLALVFAKHGAASLALGAIASNVVTGIVAWWHSGKKRVLRPSLKEWRAIANFGGQNAGAGLIISAAIDANDLVVGKVLGFGPVAILSRAQGLINLFQRDLLGAIKNVAYPAFARAHREGKNVDELFAASATTVSAIAWPFYGFLSLFPLEILRLLYGNQWDQAVPLVPIIAAGGVVAAIGSLIPNYLMAIGHFQLSLKTDVLGHIIKIVLVVTAVLTIRSLDAAATAYSVASAIGTALFFRARASCVMTRPTTLGKGLFKSFFVTAATLAAAAACSILSGLNRVEPISYWTFAGIILCSAVSWLIAIELLGHPISQEPAFRAAREKLKRAFGRNRA